MEEFNWIPPEKLRESDALRTVEARMARGGAPRTDYGKVTEAARMADMPETQTKIAEAMGMTPPMTSEMIKHSGDYQEYMNSVVEGRPMTKQGYFGGSSLPLGMGGAVQGGIPAYTDPLNSQARWGIPTWREQDPPEMKKETQRQAREWCRWYYHNHPIVPTCMDIYAKYPFVGLDIQCPDPLVEETYKTIFFDILNYEEMLPNAALQYWINGEAALLGQWDSNFGGWVEDQVVNSDDIDVITWPGLTRRKEAYLWYPPMDLVQILQEQDMQNPLYTSMLDNFGDEILGWAEGMPSELPGDVFSLLRFGKFPNENRGYPILMRAFYSLMMEEKLKQAMTAVADRLYTPFMVVKLGSKDLLQGQYPWMPTEAQMKSMQAYLEMVMISKYRLMVYHSGIEFENPFEGQTIPELQQDFDRITTEILNVFGISKELIQGGGSGTYAAGALSAEIMMQQLATTQSMWSRWWIMERAKKVAEAQGFYELERKGNTFTKPTERVPVWDQRTQTMRVVERRKLMLPAIRMETMDWRDQETKARGLQELRRQFDIPISDQRLVSFYDTDLDIDDERTTWKEERESQYSVIQELGPAAPMQRTMMQPGMGGAGGGMGMGGPGGGGRPPGSRSTPMTPGSGPMEAPNMAEGVGAGMPGAGNRPPVSDAFRATQPNTGGPGPITSSLEEPDPNINYITVQSGDPTNTKMSEVESGFAKEAFQNKDEEDIKGLVEGTRRYKQQKKDAKNAYQGYNRMRVFGKTGKKKGTLYFMQGERTMAVRVK
jgi:hypothetical protein